MRRAFDYAATQQLQAEQEARFLEEDLWREAAGRVVLGLVGVKKRLDLPLSANSMGGIVL